MVFEDYSKFYDTFYKDKDYSEECDFIESVFQRYSGRPVKTILDLGCGTGGHTIPLAERGYLLTGVDLSAWMLKEAKVSKNDVVYDLGCGDGRIVVAAAKKYECKAIGYEIDRSLFDHIISKISTASTQIANSKNNAY